MCAVAIGLVMPDELFVFRRLLDRGRDEATVELEAECLLVSVTWTLSVKSQPHPPSIDGAEFGADLSL